VKYSFLSSTRVSQQHMLLRLSTLFLLCVLSLTSCTFAVIRPIDEDTVAKAGFNALAYVDGIWDLQLIPTIRQEAVDYQTILAAIDKDKDAAIKQYGHRSGTGSYSFMVKGEAKAVSVDTKSRAGILNIEFAPYDGSAPAKIGIGPVIAGNAVRDAVGFIQFNDFTNQLDFADVTKELNKRVSTVVVKQVDMATISGKTISFYGAFTLDDRAKIVITPVILEAK
jgi:predicted lipoprotein